MPKKQSFTVNKSRNKKIVSAFFAKNFRLSIKSAQDKFLREKNELTIKKSGKNWSFRTFGRCFSGFLPAFQVVEFFELKINA
jgi:hypothetical protein